MANYRLERALGFPVELKQGLTSPEAIFFAWGRTPAPVYWSAATFDNALMTYGDRKDQFESRMRRLARLSELPVVTPELDKTSRRMSRRYNKQESGFKFHGHLALYDFTGTADKLAQQMSKKAPNFTYKTTDDPCSLLKYVDEFKQLVRKAYSGSPYGAVRREGLILALHFDSKSMDKLKSNSHAIALLEELFADSRQERIFTLIFLEDARDLTPALMKHAHQALMLGETNKKLAEAFYKAQVIPNTSGLLRMGYIWDKNNPAILREITSIQIEKEQWLIDRQEAVKQQEEAWQRYLSSLESRRQ